jgi:hypothetical protein
VAAGVAVAVVVLAMNVEEVVAEAVAPRPHLLAVEAVEVDSAAAAVVEVAEAAAGAVR